MLIRYNYVLYMCVLCINVHTCGTCVHIIVFRWGSLLESVPTYISTSMSASQESGRSVSNTTYSVSHPTNIPKWAYSVASCWAISVHWCGTFLKQHIHVKWNVQCSDIHLQLWITACPYQPWNCIIKGKFLRKCTNPLTTFQHVLCGTCSK